MHTKRDSHRVAAFVFNVFYNWIQCNNWCPLHKQSNTVVQGCVHIFKNISRIFTIIFPQILRCMKSECNWVLYLHSVSLCLLHSVAPPGQTMSQFISFIIISRPYPPAHRVVLPLVWLHPLWHRICISEWIRLCLCHTHTYSQIHIRIRMYSCAHISCLAAVCGLEYSYSYSHSLVVPKSKPQLNRSTGSDNSNRHRHSNNISYISNISNTNSSNNSNKNKLGLQIWNHFICALNKLECIFKVVACKWFIT